MQRPVEHEEARVARVVVVGGANVDIQGFSFGDFVPADSNPGRIVRSSGGVGRNIAENLARLGMEVSLLTVFGDSEDGQRLRRECDAAGIDVGPSLIVPGRTPTYLALMDCNGALIGAVADMDAMEKLTVPEMEDRAGLLDAASFIVVDTNIPKETLDWLVSRYGTAQCGINPGIASVSSDNNLTAQVLHKPFLVLDPVSSAKAKKAAGMLGAFGLVKPNRSECAVLAGIKSEDPKDLCKALRDKGQSPKELYLSLGEQGLFCCVQNGQTLSVELPPPSRCPKPINRSGAGDAALAALIWATDQGFPLRDKAQYALTASILTAASEDSVCKDLSEARLLQEKQRMFDFGSDFGFDVEEEGEKK